MPDFERTALEGRGQAHNKRPDHGVVLFGVLVLDKELPRRIDQHRVQLRPKRAAGGKAEVVAEAVEDGQERLVPTALIDLDPALGDRPGVSDPPVQKGLLSSSVSSRST